MCKLILILILFNQVALAGESGKSAKETINQGADNIDRETRKVIKKGKELWNDKIENPKPKK